MNTSCFHRPAPGGRRKGVALVVILAFVALLTALVLAYFSYSSLQRQISSASSNQTTADLFARGAVNTIVGDLRQEIVAGSTISTVTVGSATVTNYFPSTNFTAVPAPSGFTTNTGLENLVKISRNGTSFFPSSANYNTATYPPANRAAGVSSTNASQNGRAISLARWNKSLLLSSTAATNGTFTPPDWILVNRAGGNPTAWNTNMIWSGSAAAMNTVIGRYAYAIYDEGGLLDINVAGYPPGTPSTISAYKYGGMPYADLTQVGLNTNTISALVGWRNAASAQPTGSFPNYTFNATAQTNFYQAVLQNASGFLRTANTNMNSAGESDHMFISRQEFLKFFDSLAASGLDTKTNLQSSARYLGTFSRSIEQPSYISPVQSNPSAPIVLAASLGGNSAVGGDKLINPSFPKTRVQASFTRNDGSTANPGDPLVNKRFALQRLAWITYKGPSSTRAQGDADIQSLINNGVTWDFLQQGSPENIQKYFGLTWDNANSRWKYNIHNGGGTGSGNIMLVGRPTFVAPNANTYVQDAVPKREPDFFELLKAGITVGSLGKASASSAISAAAPPGYAQAHVPVNTRYNLDTSVEYHVIQIAANILSEVNPTSFPIRIAFDDGTARGLREFQGVTDLPYLNYVFNGVLRERLPAPVHPTGGNQAVDSSPFQYPTAQVTTLTDPGNAYMIQVPAVWNPYDPNGTPGILRPAKYRLIVESNDPLSPSGSGEQLLCHFASAAGSMTAGSGVGMGNAGLGPAGAVYSLNATGLGKSTEQFGVSGSPVFDAVTFNDSNGTLYREPTLIFSTVAPGNATRVGALPSNSPGGNIASLDPNPLPAESDGSTGLWAPLVLGQFPLAFASGTTAYYTGMGYIALTAGNGDNRVYFTYRLQYQDPANINNWITYDTKYGRTTHGLFGFQSAWNQNNPIFSSSVIKGPDWYSAYSWSTAIDPRTARFGLITETYNGGRSRATGAAPADVGWIFNSGGAATTLGITYPIRPDNSSGFCLVNLDSGNPPPGAPTGDANFGMLALGGASKDSPFPSFSAGWTSPVYPVNEGHGESDVWMFAPGLLAQNNPSAPIYAPSNKNGTVIEPSYYADADGVVRRATGAYVLPVSGASASSPVGLPTSSINGYTGKPASLETPATATPFTQSQSRPLLLHRPFRTVAELGYVFRDVPWKNLDFSTPESGDAALLDLFCINDVSDSDSLAAGKVNLNTRQAPVLAAIISGAYVDDPKVSNATVGSLSSSLSGTIASAVVARTSGTTNYGPLQNVSELIGKWNAAVAPSASGITYTTVVSTANGGIDLPSASGYVDGKLSYTGFSGIYLSGATTASSPPTDLSSAFSAASYSNASFQTSISQIQRFREAPIRALASVGQTRVWNLMIDVVAQTGRYPQSASALDKFVVEGEQRYWVHLAIDRLTGRVVDKQIETIKE